MRRNFAILAILIIASLLLAACGGSNDGPTETQITADLCLRGNKEACAYNAALLEKEVVDAKVKLTGDAFRKTEATPQKKVVPTATTPTKGG